MYAYIRTSSENLEGGGCGKGVMVGKLRLEKREWGREQGREGDRGREGGRERRSKRAEKREKQRCTACILRRERER